MPPYPPYGLRPAYPLPPPPPGYPMPPPPGYPAMPMMPPPPQFPLPQQRQKATNGDEKTSSSHEEKKVTCDLFVTSLFVRLFVCFFTWTFFLIVIVEDMLGR